MKKCKLCNRPLKSPASIARGIGPYCWSKIVREAEAEAGIENDPSPEHKAPTKSIQLKLL